MLEQEQSTNALIKSLTEMKQPKLNLERNDSLNKHLNVMLLENNIKKIQGSRSKFETLNDKLNEFSSNNELQQSKI